MKGSSTDGIGAVADVINGFELGGPTVAASFVCAVSQEEVLAGNELSKGDTACMSITLYSLPDRPTDLHRSGLRHKTRD